MSWLRIDDGFSRHPKVLSLTAVERWVWIDVLCWAAKYAEDDGSLPASADGAIPGLKKLRPKLRELGLIDAGELIHDWYLYSSASLAEKVIWYLERHPAATANEVARQVGGTRSLVLAEVRKYHEGGSNNGAGNA